jgi:transcription antitermination factor NusG
MSDWIIAICLRTEAYERLMICGETCYRPMYRVRLRWRGRQKWVTRPLLGRYLLVELEAAHWAEQFHRIARVRGIAGILTREEKPMVARQSEVDVIRASEVRGYVPAPKKVRFVPQQHVRISRGPLIDVEGKFVKSKGELDVVAVSLLGGPREIMLPAGSLLPA